MNITKETDSILLIEELTGLTQRDQLKWALEVDRQEYRAFKDNYAFSIVRIHVVNYSLTVLDSDGEEVRCIESTEVTRGSMRVLFETIIKFMDRKKDHRVISMHKFGEVLLRNHPKMKSYSYRVDNSFKVLTTEQKGYICPPMSQQPTSMGYTPLSQATVVLICAPGATGKTAMTEYLSYNRNIPVFNLAEKEAVGGYSLVGKLFSVLPNSELSPFLQSLQDASGAVIIDALDEGYTQTGQNAFNSFLDNLVDIAKSSAGLPFVIFGRTYILEYAVLYLEEKGIKVAMLQIEPFLIEQAYDFINKQLNDDPVTLSKDFRATRDYIIKRIGGFFTDMSDMSHHLYQRFIGYAPVLLSISTLLDKKPRNYSKLLADLQRDNRSNVGMVIDILDTILKREQTKISEALDALLESFGGAPFINKVKEKAYSQEEQCRRLFYKIYGIGSWEAKLTDDSTFNEKYEEMINSFADHPFLVNQRKPQNKVFESYILVKMLSDPACLEDVVTYIEYNRGNSYMFFDLFAYYHHGGSVISPRLVPYLIESFQMTDRVDNKGIISIDGEITDKDNVRCEISFLRYGETEGITYIVSTNKDFEFHMPASLSNITIEAPIRVVCDTGKSELQAPLYIQSKTLRIESSSLTLSSSEEGSVVFECDEFVARSKNDELQSISNPGDVPFYIITQSSLYHPFYNYRVVAPSNPDDDDFAEKYQKMRRTLLLFRGYRSGSLGKVMSKINNRICSSECGKKVVAALLSSGVIYQKERMYFINPEKQAEVLGVKYDDLHSCKINDKINKFISNIK